MLKLSNNIKKIFKLFQQSNKQIYLVGGCVRDIIMGVVPHDYDFTTDATPDEMKKIAHDAGIEIIPTGEKYGTLTFHLDDEFYEITTFRAEGTYGDGRRPDKVTFSHQLKDDLCRRDFTFNAMCFAYDESTNGVRLVDLYNGRQDINRRVINTIGAAQDRFTEDALRMLRAIRFAYKLNFQLSKEIQQTIKNNVSLLHNVSAERIREELLQIFSYCKEWDPNRGPALQAVMEFLLDLKVDLASLCIYSKPIVMFCNLQYECMKRNKKIDFRTLLKLSNEQMKQIDSILACLDLFNKQRTTSSRLLLKQCLDICDKDTTLVEDAIQLITDNISTFLFDQDDLLSELHEIVNNHEPITIADLVINGDDLQELGLRGKQIGAALQTCKQKVQLDPRDNNKKTLLTIIRQDMVK